jgi:hypothetical protein
MSHKATNWAIEQRGLKPTAKVVLFHLADRHNPDNGCFPSQERLATDCEISRASLNKQLALLEAQGLLRRIQRRSETTKRQLSTRYVFAFEDGFDETPPAPMPTPVDDNTNDQALQLGLELPCPEIGHGAVSSFDVKPCPENDESRVQNLDTNFVREPLREPCVCGDAADIENGFREFWEVYPRKRDLTKSKALFEMATIGGVRIKVILNAAKRYRAENTGNKAMYLAYSDNWLDARRWEDYPDDAEVKAPNSVIDDMATFWAKKIKGNAYIPATAISREVAVCMIGNGLVLESDLRRVGVLL